MKVLYHGRASREGCRMCNLTFLTAIVVLSAPQGFSGLNWAGNAECKSLCVLTASSQSSGGHREGGQQGQGLNRANDVGKDHGSGGRDNARQKQDAHRPGGSGVSVPVPDSTSASAPVLDPSKMDPLMTAPTCSLC